MPDLGDSTVPAAPSAHEPPTAETASVALERLARLAAHSLRAPWAWIYLTAHGRRPERWYGASAGTAGEAPTAAHSAAEHLCREIAATGAAVERTAAGITSVGVPLRSSRGLAAGALCVAGAGPRAWTAEDTALLAEGAALAESVLASQRRARHLEALAARFHAAYEHVAIGVFITDTQDQLLSANPAFCEMVGYTREELRQLSILAITHPDDHAGWCERRDLIAAGVTRSITYEQRFVRKDGTLMWTQVTVSRTDGPHGGPGHCVSIAEDISQRKQLEDALRQSATEAAARAGELQAVFDAMVDAVTLYDAEGRAIHENAADRELFGINAYTPRYHALPLHERLSLYHLHTPSGRTLRPDEYPAVRALRGEVIKGTSAVDLVVHTLDGRERVVSTSGAPVRDAEGRITGAICIYHDVTDRYELQRAMAARANLLQTVFESMTDALLVYSRDGQIVQMNSAARVIFGHDHDPEFQSRPLGERLTQMSLRDEEERLLPQERWPQTRVLRGEVLTGAETVELSVRTVDGRDVPISVTGAPVRDHAGALVGAVCVARDVTSRRQLERQKDEFLGIASHELRTPLTSIKVLAQLIAETLAASPLDELERPAHLMLQAISRMERLVGDLLDASRIHAGTLAMRPTACDLAAICRQQAEEQAAATGRTLRLELPAEPLVIDADADRMGQVVANLLSNALKYSAAVYPVSLRLQRTDGQALLAVTDHGPGIPEEARPQLFERFYRVPNIEVLSGSGVGIGLGLYITREMVQRHGGRIWLESEVGQGSTFIVALPLRLGTADQREARRDSEASMTTAATRQSSQVCTNLTPRPPSLAGKGEPGGTADGRGGGLGRPFPLHVGLTTSGC